MTSKNFQLYDRAKTTSENPIIAKFQTKFDDISIDLSILSKYSGLVNKIINQASTQQNDGNELIIQNFKKEFQKFCKNFGFDDYSIGLVLSIFSGATQRALEYQLFNLFIISKHFEVSKLLEFINSYCQEITGTFIIDKLLCSWIISKGSEQYLSEFLDLGQMKQKLIDNVADLFNKYYFKDIPVTVTIEILEGCKDKTSIPADKLYLSIISSIEKKQCLLPFLDRSKLYKYQQENLDKAMKKIKPTTNTPNTPKEDSANSHQNPPTSSSPSSIQPPQYELSSSKIETNEKPKESQSNQETGNKGQTKERKIPQDTSSDKDKRKIKELESNLKKLEEENKALKIKNMELEIKISQDASMNAKEARLAKEKIKELEDTNQKYKLETEIKMEKLEEENNKLKNQLKQIIETHEKESPQTRCYTSYDLEQVGG